MTDRDTITLPREVVEGAIKAFENGCPSTCEKGMVDSGGFHPWGEPALVPCPACLAFEHLRTHLAAEQPKPEPVATVGTQSAAWKGYDGRWSPPGDPIKVVHLLRDLPLGTLLYAAPPDAPTVKESLTHPGYVIGSHWLETAYSRICAGEAEADVLRDCGWERVDQALRRDAERLTDEQIDSATSKERDELLDHIYEYGTAAEGILERIRKLARAAIDAAMKEET